MGRYLEQNASGNVVIGPMVNISGTLLSALTIANNQIVLIKEGSVSVGRSDTTSAVSVGPGMYRIGLNATDTNTMGTLIVYVSASAALQYAERAEVWQSTTYKLFYGSADQIATSAAVSQIVSAVGSLVAGRALTDYDAATSSDISAIVTAVVNNVFTLRQVPSSAAVSGIVVQALSDYDVASSSDISAIVSVVGSLVAGRALSNYDVASSGDVSAIFAGVGGGITSAQVSGIVIQALTDYDVASSSDVSTIVSAIVSAVVSQVVYGVVLPNANTAGFIPSSAQVSSMAYNAATQVMVDRDIPSSARISTLIATMNIPSSAAVSVLVQGIVTGNDLPTSADISAIGAGVLANYDVPTSADISSITSAVVSNAVWNHLFTEPVTAVQWQSARVHEGFGWLLARSLNRHSQTATTIEIYSSAGTVIASASVSNNSVSATRDQFLG